MALPGNLLDISVLTHLVKVKWSKEVFDLEINPDDTGEVLKSQCYSLTGVEPHRQKILSKGGMLKDETRLRELGIKAGHTFMLLGKRSEDIIEVPDTEVESVQASSFSIEKKVQGAFESNSRSKCRLVLEIWEIRVT